MASSSIAAELQQLQQYETYEPIVRRLGVSAAALYVWDFTLTFHHEVSILWGTKWTKSRTLFFINRYFGLGAIIASAFFNVETNPTISICHGWLNFDIIGVLLVLNIEIILLRRLFVLYDHRRVIVIPMVVLFFVVFISMMGIAIALSVYSQANSFVILGICAGPTPSWFLPFWMPLMAFDFLIMGLAGFKSVQHYRRVPNKKWSGAQLMKTLARDSFIYFACNFFNYLAITLIFHLAAPEFFQLGSSWTIVIPPITANHLLINMEQSRFTKSDSATNSTSSVESEYSGDMEMRQRHFQSTTLLA